MSIHCISVSSEWTCHIYVYIFNKSNQMWTTSCFPLSYSFNPAPSQNLRFFYLFFIIICIYVQYLCFSLQLYMLLGHHLLLLLSAGYSGQDAPEDCFQSFVIIIISPFSCSYIWSYKQWHHQVLHTRPLTSRNCVTAIAFHRRRGGELVMLLIKAQRSPSAYVTSQLWVSPCEWWCHVKKPITCFPNPKHD